MSQSLSQTLQDLLVGLLSDPSIITDTTVTGISMDSRELSSGDLFVAVAKETSQRSEHLQQALEAKVAVVLFDTQHPLTEQDSEQLKLTSIAVLPIKNLTSKISEIAARFYGHPSLALTIIGITGTNGKTSVSQFIAQALESLGLACGVIGTLGTGRINALSDTGMTTPDPVSIQRVLYDFCLQDIQYAVIESSSHALVQGRLNSVAIDVAVFTNLTRDHLDYHHTMAEYAAAKAMLFDFPSVKTAIINRADEFGQQLISQLEDNNNLDLITYSSLSNDVNAHFNANNIQLTASGLRFDLSCEKGEVTIESSLFGHFNSDNLLASIACLNAIKVDFKQLISAIKKCKAVDGRMELVQANEEKQQQSHIIIDFAHTPDALTQALKSLQQHLQNEGDLWCVFGCGGDRDIGKRALMGGVAEEYADKIIITDDNPRSERSEKIINDILVGIKQAADIIIESDRKLAITHAIRYSNPKDIILIAGKGHEQYQEILGHKTPFSDKQIAIELLAANDASPLVVGDAV